MDIASIGAAYKGLKFAKDALQVALGYKIETETRAQITAALEKLGAAQDSLFEMREELFRLQSDNENLRREIAVRDSWAAEKGRYRLQQTAGGAMVYESNDSPKHYACPACFAKSIVQILQDQRVSSGSFACPSCQAGYLVKPRQEFRTEGGTARRSVSEW